ncbi:hypothetical protein [Flavobacterium praedii]|uniref:hypothetical protein n=1 Tax=Flavobacterium praedii TaxID=3002900 RepID=UPI0024820926|nr:hypothetical protein [Flavobacterium praedii]
MKDTIIQITKYFGDYLVFILLVLSGLVVKIHFALKKGKAPSFKWFLAEAVVSFFVAFSVYAVFDQFLQCNKPFTYIACAWGGSMSTMLHDKVEDLISEIFFILKILIKSKFIK